MSLVSSSAGKNEKTMQQTFVGALAAEFLESKSVVRSVKFAIIVSLLTRAKFGNLEKVLSRPELEQYAVEHGIDLYR
jgi:sugar/nucleoside kinase (ribokinase family)